MSDLERKKYEEGVSTLQELLRQKSGGDLSLERIFEKMMKQGEADWKAKNLTPASAAYAGGIQHKLTAFSKIFYENDVIVDSDITAYWLISHGYDDGIYSF